MACPLVNSLGLLVSHWAAISLEASYWSDIYEIEISSILDRLVHGLFTDLEEPTSVPYFELLTISERQV